MSWTKISPDHVYAPGSPGYFDAFARGYQREEDADRARMESGAKAKLDAYDPWIMLKDFVVGSDVTSPGEASFQPGRGIEHARRQAELRQKPVRQGFGGRVKLRKRY